MRVSRLLCVAAILAFCCSAAGAGQPHDLEGLMSLLAQVEYVEAEYREIVESSLLSVPISSRGRLEYRAPDWIRMSSDKGDRFEISGETLRILRNGRLVRELSTSDHSAIESLVSALKAIFAGDLERLQQHYRLRFQGGGQDWSMDLVPVAPGTGLPIALAHIGVRGAGATIEGIELTESDGDVRRLRMRVLDRKPASLP